MAFFRFEDGSEPDFFLIPGYAWLAVRFFSMLQDSNRHTGKNLNQSFDKHPDHWGLRGDPSLWAELQAHFKTKQVTKRFFTLSIMQ